MIYIAGKISGLDLIKAKKNFKKAEVKLSEKGYKVVNPMKEIKVDVSKTWEDYMIESFALLLKCDSIYMLNNWQTSKGARVEYAVAKSLGMSIIFQQGKINN